MRRNIGHHDQYPKRKRHIDHVASAAASALDVNRTKSGFVSELDRINASMDKVTQGLSAPTGNIIKAPDGSGTDIEIVD